VIVADCDHEALASVRRQVPSLAHRRPEAYDHPT
jgi:predicted amidohydrolase